MFYEIGDRGISVQLGDLTSGRGYVLQSVNRQPDCLVRGAPLRSAAPGTLRILLFERNGVNLPYNRREGLCYRPAPFYRVHTSFGLRAEHHGPFKHSFRTHHYSVHPPRQFCGAKKLAGLLIHVQNGPFSRPYCRTPVRQVCRSVVDARDASTPPAPTFDSLFGDWLAGFLAAPATVLGVCPCAQQERVLCGWGKLDFQAVILCARACWMRSIATAAAT